jgi:hypothetical protein
VILHLLGFIWHSWWDPASAKARVILGIDGLEQRTWGSRDNSRPSAVADNKRSDSKDDAEANEANDEPEGNEDEETDDEESANSSDNSDGELSRQDLVDQIPHVSRAEEQNS